MSVLWLNGQILDDSQGQVGAFDPGLLLGDGLFETIAAYDRRPFALPAHLDRLERSGRALGLAAFSREELEAAVFEALSHWDGGELQRVRVTLWRASDAAGLGAESRVCASVIVSEGHGPLLGEPNLEQARVVTSAFVRNELSALTGHKATSFAENVHALRAAQAAGATEAVLFNSSGQLSEGSMSNVVLEADGELVTPPLTSGCLPGITRAFALFVAEHLALPFRQAEAGELTRDEVERIVSGGGSAALLGTMRNLQHVESWDSHTLERGPVLQILERAMLTEMVALVSP